MPANVWNSFAQKVNLFWESCNKVTPSTFSRPQVEERNYSKLSSECNRQIVEAFLDFGVGQVFGVAPFRISPWMIPSRVSGTEIHSIPCRFSWNSSFRCKPRCVYVIEANGDLVLNQFLWSRLTQEYEKYDSEETSNARCVGFNDRIFVVDY